MQHYLKECQGLGTQLEIVLRIHVSNYVAVKLGLKHTCFLNNVRSLKIKKKKKEKAGKYA